MDYTDDEDKYKFPSYLEIWGLKVEMFGLLILVLASIWEVAITNRTDKYTLESKDQVQLVANTNLLLGVQDIALALKAKDIKHKEQYLKDAYDTTQEAHVKITEINMYAKSLEQQLFSWQRLVHKAHFIFGALMVIVGKYMVYTHKRRIVDKERDARYKAFFL